MRKTMRALLLMPLAAAALLSARVETSMNAENRQIDHVIVGTADLNRGIEEFRRLTGVTAIAGGVHPGRGTQNALAALDKGRYLEILAPVRDAPPSQTVTELRSLKTLTPFGWAVSTDDVDASVKFLKDIGFAGSPRIPGSRVKADGSRLEWVSFGVTPPDLELAPFFINWSASSRHPSSDSPAGCSLASMVIELPAAARSRRLLEQLAVGVEVKTAKVARIEITLRCPNGTVRLG